jgi:hypothetical protein
MTKTDAIRIRSRQANTIWFLLSQTQQAAAISCCTTASRPLFLEWQYLKLNRVNYTGLSSARTHRVCT